MSAFGGKADMNFGLHMSASDPERTSTDVMPDPFRCAGGGASPLIRANIFKHLHHVGPAILTSGVLLILTIDAMLFSSDDENHTIMMIAPH
jgi:hypothetical protein